MAEGEASDGEAKGGESGVEGKEGGKEKDKGPNILDLTDRALKIVELEQPKIWRFIGILFLLVGIGLIPSALAEGSTTKSVTLQFVGLGLGLVFCVVGVIIVALTGRRPKEVETADAAETPEPIAHVVRELTDTASTPRISRYADTILEGYKSSGQRQWTIIAPSGHGKSSLLGRLAHVFDQREAQVVSVSAPKSLETYRSCQALVESIADDAPEEARAELENATLRAFNRLNADVDLTELLGRYAEDVQEALSAIDGELLLLVDDFHEVIDAEARSWTLNLLTRIASPQRRLVVLTSRRPEVAAGFGVQMQLPRHSAAEVAEETKSRLAHAASGSADSIIAYSSGVPVGVEAALRLVARDGIDALRSRVVGSDVNSVTMLAGEELLAQLDADAAKMCGTFASGRRLSDWLAVLDRFGDEYLKEILQNLLVRHEDVDQGAADRLAAWLPTQAHVVGAVDDNPKAGFQLLPFLRHNRLSNLAVGEPQRRAFLHASAEREYWNTMNADPEDLPQVHLQSMQSRFESAEWHRITLEWLTHAFSSSPVASPEVARACATLFFKRYYWYDVIAPTIYCKELLTEYRRRWPTEPWVKPLEDFRANYTSGPYSPGWSKRDDNRRKWENAEDAISALVEALGLPRAAAQVTDETREAYVYIGLVRADPLRFAHLEQAAIKLWENLRTVTETEWIIPWINVFEAETLLELDRADEAEIRFQGVEDAAVHEDSKDNDLRMIAGEVRSDLLWRGGDRPAAVAVLTRTVLVAAAYHLQQEPENDLKLSLPNDYSVLRHQHAVDRLLGRLAEVEKVDGKAARKKLEAQISNFFEPYWRRARTRGSHSQELYPPVPTKSDLLNPDQCKHDINWGILTNMEPQLNQPLTDPLP